MTLAWGELHVQMNHVASDGFQLQDVHTRTAGAEARMAAQSTGAATLSSDLW